MNENSSLSWRGAVTRRRRAIADSENTDSELDRENASGLLKKHPGLDQSSFCANCSSSKGVKSQGLRDSRKSKPSLLSNSSESKVPYKSNSYREELEMKVLNDELNEQESTGKQTENRQLLDDLSEMLRTLSIYAHCMDVRHKVSAKLLELVDRMAPERDLYRPVKEATSGTSMNKKLQDLVQSTGESCEHPDAYSENLEDFREKQKNFNRATANFCRILQNGSGVSNTQLRKLELQYDEIRASYCASKSTLSSQLDDLIDARIEMVDRCFQSLAQVLNQTLESDKEMLGLLRETPSVREIISGAAGPKLKPHRVTSDRSLSPKKSFYCRNSERRMDECENSASPPPLPRGKELSSERCTCTRRDHFNKLRP